MRLARCSSKKYSTAPIKRNENDPDRIYRARTVVTVAAHHVRPTHKRYRVLLRFVRLLITQQVEGARKSTESRLKEFAK